MAASILAKMTSGVAAAALVLAVLAAVAPLPAQAEDGGWSAALHGVQSLFGASEKPAQAGPVQSAQAETDPAAAPPPDPAAGAAPAPASDAAPAAPASAWAVACADQPAGEFACEMTQSVVDSKTRQVLVVISVKGVAAGGSNAMLFRLFHGIYLPGGLNVAIDSGAATNAAFQKSDRNGVYAVLPLDGKLIKAMGKGSKLGLTFELNKGQPLTIEAVLTGFDHAYARINSGKPGKG